MNSIFLNKSNIREVRIDGDNVVFYTNNSNNSKYLVEIGLKDHKAVHQFIFTTINDLWSGFIDLNEIKNCIKDLPTDETKR